MRYYLDEDVHLLVAVIGRALGLDITHTQEYGVAHERKGTKDEEQLRFAAQEGRVLVTGNCTDFQPITDRFVAEELPHAGILCISPRLAQRAPAETAHALLRYEHEHQPGVPPYLVDWLR